MNKPWLTEPNMVKWVDQATGLACLILRASELGHLCGYVRIPRRHPLYAHGWQRRVEKLQAHGGITFTGEMHRQGGGKRPGRWIGFDCAHAWDLVPGFEELGFKDKFVNNSKGAYRDIAYVTAQVERMARQVKAMAKS